MYVAHKKVAGHSYLQIVESWRKDGKPRQRVVLHVGRFTDLAQAIREVDDPKRRQLLALLAEHPHLVTSTTDLGTRVHRATTATDKLWAQVCQGVKPQEVAALQILRWADAVHPEWAREASRLSAKRLAEFFAEYAALLSADAEAADS
jgi:hypothetical protein